MFIASLFAILTPLCISVDMLTTWPVLPNLAAGPMFSFLGFMVLVVVSTRPDSMTGVHRSLAILIDISIDCWAQEERSCKKRQIYRPETQSSRYFFA